MRRIDGGSVRDIYVSHKGVEQRYKREHKKGAVN